MPQFANLGEQPVFLSTPSARRATSVPMAFRLLLPYFYPRPPRGGRHEALARGGSRYRISIHALREEGDFDAGKLIPFYVDISIHALREEGDLADLWSACLHFGRFLSTPSARRATSSGDAKRRQRAFLSTPSARRATSCIFFKQFLDLISIHALREEGDLSQGRRGHSCCISIHALREEGDSAPGTDQRSKQYISIHALREEGDQARL